ncbi:MAG TPA: hypothetical protein VKD90_25115 [Gemmataceae bacterium]|nr:hypothetical protein [Gemmataceae bacterium]
MRILAGGGAGALVAIVGLVAWGAATGGRGGAVAWLFCLGGVVVPAGFAVGCAVGAVVSVARALVGSGAGPDYWK